MRVVVVAVFVVVVFPFFFSLMDGVESIICF